MQTRLRRKSAEAREDSAGCPRRTGRLLGLLPVAFPVAMACVPLASAQTGTVQFSQSAYSVNVSQGTAFIPVLCSASTDTTVTVDFLTTSGGSALTNVDYVPVSNTLTFAAGTFTNTGTISILNNGVNLSTQTVNLALVNVAGPAALGVPATAILTIINDELQQIQFAQSAYFVDDTRATAVITLVRTGGTNGTATVDFSTSDGSAKAGINYTATQATVTFTNGVTTNTVEIPLLHPTGPSTNQTVNLTLSNPTGVATLGSPTRAVLTIVATGPPVIQLSAASYSVHEHVGRGTITAIRFGDSSAQASVDYATSDGTAINGIDYYGTSGTMIFPPDASRGSFSFQIQKFPTFQSNKTVHVELSNPVDASLGDRNTAVLTIVNDKPQTITFTNSSGTAVTLLLRFAGTMSMAQSEPLDLLLESTDGASVLTISAKKGRGMSGPLEIDQIAGAGSCRLIDAGDFDLVGAGVQLGETLKELRIRDIGNGAAVTANGSPDQNTKIRARNIDDGSAIALGSRLKNLTAARLGDGVAIMAPRIGTVSIRGDKRNQIPADCGGVFDLSGDGLATNQFAFGKLSVAGVVANASIVVANGGVGSVAASQIIDSTIYVGYEPTDPDNPLTGGGTFTEGLRVRSVSVRSRVDGFANSVVAASRIGKVHLASVQTDNAGTPFGVVAGENISAVSVQSPPFKWMPNGADDQTLGDFHVIW
jgi:hypothetical protein